MQQEILIKLKEAEATTAQDIEAAHKAATKAVRDARAKARQRVADAEQQAREANEATIAAERTRLEGEKEKILAAGAEREAALRTTYEARAADALQSALKAFEETL